jgi:hypothetical protein
LLVFTLEDGTVKKVPETAKLRQLAPKLEIGRQYRLTYRGELPMGSDKSPMRNFVLDEVLPDTEPAEPASSASENDEVPF